MKLKDLQRWYWETQDWAKGNAHLSIETGCSIALVAKWRMMLGKQRPRKGPQRSDPKCKTELVAQQVAERREAWAAWDWNKNNIELALEHDISRERVRQIRGLLGRAPHLEEITAKLDSMADRLPGMFFSDICHESGATHHFLRRYLQGRGIEIKRSKVPFSSVEKPVWSFMNWHLPTITLAEIWNMKSVDIANRRSRDGRPLPKFRVHTGRVTNGNAATFELLVANEKTKAMFYNELDYGDIVAAMEAKQ